MGGPKNFTLLPYISFDIGSEIFSKGRYFVMSGPSDMNFDMFWQPCP